MKKMMRLIVISALLISCSAANALTSMPSNTCWSSTYELQANSGRPSIEEMVWQAPLNTQFKLKMEIKANQCPATEKGKSFWVEIKKSNKKIKLINLCSTTRFKSGSSRLDRSPAGSYESGSIQVNQFEEIRVKFSSFYNVKFKARMGRAALCDKPDRLEAPRSIQLIVN